MFINALLGRQGSVRSILGLETDGKITDISNDDWNRIEILSGLNFDRISLTHKKISVDFVCCEFKESQFVGLESDAHFFASSNLWENCLFKNVDLRGPISPMNTFRNCRFENLKTVKYTAYQTLFDKCLFETCGFTGLSARTVLNSTKLNAELAGRRSTVLFKECRFRDVTFAACVFAGIEFERCQFEGTHAQDSAFENIISTDRWWSDQLMDPFQAFLTKALELIREQCGPDSAAYHVFEGYVLDYATAKTSNKDFSACLYSGKVPDAELDKIIDELSNLASEFPIC